MSAGMGVVHSEFNGSKSEPVHFLQIWLKPDAKGIAPGDGRHAWVQVAQGRVRVNG